LVQLNVDFLPIFPAIQLKYEVTRVKTEGPSKQPNPEPNDRMPNCVQVSKLSLSTRGPPLSPKKYIERYSFCDKFLALQILPNVLKWFCYTISFWHKYHKPPKLKVHKALQLVWTHRKFIKESGSGTTCQINHAYGLILNIDCFKSALKNICIMKAITNKSV
jgi:hypothetical protein